MPAAAGTAHNPRRGRAACEQTVGAVSGRVDATRAPQAELARAEAELARAEILEEDVEHELLSAYRGLRRSGARREPDFATVAASIGPCQRWSRSRRSSPASTQNPRLLRFVSQQRLDEAQLRSRKREADRTGVVSGGVRTSRHGRPGAGRRPDGAARWKNRNQGRIAEARANIARTGARGGGDRVRHRDVAVRALPRAQPRRRRRRHA